MRYVPNLISPSSKVLPDYFKGNIYKSAKKNPISNLVLWVLGILFLIGALSSIAHPIISIMYGLIGCILIPPGQRFIERKMKFQLIAKIKVIAASLLFITSLPFSIHYNDTDLKIAYQQKLEEEKTAKEKALADKIENQRKDSLAFYIQQGIQLTKDHKINEAGKQFQYASFFASSPLDKAKIEKGRIGIAAIQTYDLIKAGKYKAAIPQINNLLNSDPSNAELIYNRAYCYSETGQIQEAVNDLQPLIQARNIEAENLHNKINPIRKRISYYVTRCWDGTT